MGTSPSTGSLVVHQLKTGIFLQAKYHYVEPTSVNKSPNKPPHKPFNKPFSNSLNMPSEAEQSKLLQPWKEWHGFLNPMGREDVREGTVVIQNPDSNHGTVAIDKKEVDLKADKELPKM